MKFSRKISVGDIFNAKVGSIEDYGAFLHLRFQMVIFSYVSFYHVLIRKHLRFLFLYLSKVNIY